MEGLLQAKRVQDTEGEPDFLGLYLLAEEPVGLHRLIDVVVVRHHRVGRDQRSSHTGGQWGHLTLCGRRRKRRRRLEEEETSQVFPQREEYYFKIHFQPGPVSTVTSNRN